MAQANTTPWQSVDGWPESVQVSRCHQRQALVPDQHWEYWRVACEGRWYLYARAAATAAPHVLGVFDTAAQAELFLELHSFNPLKVPGLQVADGHWPPLWRDAQGQIQHLPYAGVYKVGLKSYRVDILEDGRRALHYIDRYASQYLGEADEVDVCLLLYSHFDARLRGCSMC